MNTQTIYLPIYTRLSGGGYTSGRSLGLPAGAKGIEEDADYFYSIPEGFELKSAPDFRGIAEKEMIKKYNDFMIMEAVEEDEDLYNEYDSLLRTAKASSPTPTHIIWVSVSKEDADRLGLVEGLPNKRPGNYGYCNIASYPEMEAKHLAAELAAKSIDEKNAQVKSLCENLAKNAGVNVSFDMRPANYARAIFSINGEKVEWPLRYYFEYPTGLFSFEAITKEVMGLKEKAAARAAKIEAARIAEAAEFAAKIAANKSANKIVELSDGRIIGFESDNITVKIPSWAAGFLIGSGGSKIKAASERIGRRIKIQIFEESAPRRRPNAYWLI